MTAPCTKVLLLGGTSETASLAMKIAGLGYRVLVSTATDASLQVGTHPAISRRCGRLGLEQMAVLLDEGDYSALVDATHPYASVVHRTARQACADTGRPYLRYQRQETPVKQDCWLSAESHEEAALLACQLRRPILLTIGSRNLGPYVQEARRQKVPLFARILNHEESICACDDAGLESSSRIFGRGPFSFEDNVALIRRHQIGVVVTKESGQVGGVEEKWRAANNEGCGFVVVKRPEESQVQCYACADELLLGLQKHHKGNMPDDKSLDLTYEKPEVCSEK